MRLLTALAVTVVSIAITVVVVVELSFFLACFCSNLEGGYS